MFGRDPNITGEILIQCTSSNGTAPVFSGALSGTKEGTNSVSYQSGAGDLRLSFDASSSDETYNSDKLQTSAIQVLACIKV